jgi:outer membrane protein assembly factor BamB
MLRNLVCLGLSIAPAMAQEANPESIYARDSNQGVYVRDSATAVEKLALAERMERLKEWNKAADIYQEVLRTLSDRVLPSQSDKENRVSQYASVSAVVHERLCRWPREALDVYRARYEGEAGALLQQVSEGDREALAKIVNLYFPTQSARDAAVRLLDDYFENGDFAAAAWLGSRILAIHPGIEIERPMLLYRTAIAFHLCGYDVEAQKKAAELKEKFSDTVGKIRGEDTSLNRALEKELESPVALQATDRDRWPMAFGAPDRARIASIESLAGAKIFGIDLLERRASGARENRNRAIMPAGVANGPDIDTADRQNGIMTGILPVFDRGELFFNDNATIYAVSLDSGQPLSGWVETYSNEASPGRYTGLFQRTPRGVLCQTVLTDSSVFAVLGQVDIRQVMFNAEAPVDRTTTLVCLDRANGRERWKIAPSQLNVDELRQATFSSAILVVGNSVYLTALNRRQGQFEDCYLLCFDASTGQLRWSNIIASSTPQSPTDLELGGGVSRASQLSYSGGRIYVLSNTGVLCALDASSGQVVWLNIYAREQANDAGMQFRRFRNQFNPNVVDAPRPWTMNPVIIANNRIVSLPADGKFIHIYDASGGQEIKRIPIGAFNADNRISTLIGVKDDKLFADNGNEVYCINWSKFDEKADMLDNLYWAVDLRKAKGTEVIRGRSLLTEKYVVVPTVSEISAIEIETGLRPMSYPPAGRSWDDEGPGNVLATSSHLIVAGPSRVNVYTDLKLAKAKLDAEIAAAPSDVAPRLRYAEVMFVAGEPEQAKSRLDDAIGIAGGDAVPAGAIRDRIFNTAMSFASKTIKRNGPREFIGQFYDRAGSMASSPQQQVSYRLNRARWSRDTQNLASQVKLLSEILVDARWRNVPVSDGSGSPTSAATIAERNIADTIRKDPTLYQPLEELAASAFTTAKASGEATALLEVAQAYPNSTIAPQAMLTAAEAYEVAKNPRLAVQVLRQMYFKYPNHPQKLQVVESLVRNYLQIPNRLDAAVARLAQAVAMDANAKLTSPLALPDGRELKGVAFSEVLQALRQYRRGADARLLPVLNVPLAQKSADGKPIDALAPESKSTTIANVRELLVPDREFARPDRIVASLTDGSLSVYAPGQSEPLLNVANIREDVVGVAWLAENLLAWTQKKVLLIDGERGEVLWEANVGAIPAIEVAAGAEADDSIGEAVDNPDPAPQEDGVAEGIQIDGQLRIEGGVVIGRNGRVLRINGRQVQNLNQPMPAPGGAGEAISFTKLLADRMIFTTSAGRLIALENSTGKTLWQARVADRAPDRLLASEDFVVVTQSQGDNQPSRVVTLDAVSGQLISRRNVGDAQQGPLINAAISSDGKLVYLLRDEMYVKDLYSQGDEPAFVRHGQRGEGNGGFVGAVQPQQLVVNEDRIYVISSNGQFVRIYSLDNGDMLMPGGRRIPGETEMGLPTGGSEWSSGILISGQRFYCVGNRAVVAYNLEREGYEWKDESLKYESSWMLRQLIPGQDVLLGVEEEITRPVNNNRQRQRVRTKPKVRLKFYSREITGSGMESGLLDMVFLDEPTGVDAVQAVNGGVVYRSLDNRLHFRKSAK